MLVFPGRLKWHFVEFCNCRYYALKKMENSTKCHFNRPGKTRIRPVKCILALFCYILTFGLFQFIGVSTTHSINLSTYYVWAACGNMLKFLQSDIKKNFDLPILFGKLHLLSLEIKSQQFSRSDDSRMAKRNKF